MASTSTLPLPVAQAHAAPVPEWVMLARTGAWLGHPTAREVVGPGHLASAFDYFERHYAAHGTDLVIDYRHASMAAPPAGAPAAGWVRAMELRNGGAELWGRVLWTTEAAGAIARREYRYLSPVFRFDRPDRLTGDPVPLQIHSVALTNTPFLTELEGLNEAAAGGAINPSSEGGMQMPILESLAAAPEIEPSPPACGPAAGVRAEDASRPAEPMATSNSLGSASTAQSPPAGPAADRAALVQLRASAAAVRQKLGLAEGAPEQDVLNALDALAAAGARSEAEDLVEGAVRDGRIPPAHRDFYLREALNDLRAAREVINSLPVLTAPASVPPRPEQSRRAGALTDGEEAVRAPTRPDGRADGRRAQRVTRPYPKQEVLE